MCVCVIHIYFHMCQQFLIERASLDKFPFKTVFDAL